MYHDPLRHSPRLTICLLLCSNSFQVCWFVVWSVGFFIRSSTLVTRRCQNFIIQLCLTQRARAESFCCDFEILGKQCAAVWAVGGLCRCRSRDGSTWGDHPGYALIWVRGLAIVFYLFSLLAACADAVPGMEVLGGTPLGTRV